MLKMDLSLFWNNKGIYTEIGVIESGLYSRWILCQPIRLSEIIARQSETVGNLF